MVNTFRFEYPIPTREALEGHLADAPVRPSAATVYSERLDGRTITIVTDDGPRFEYTFSDNSCFTLTTDGKTYKGDTGVLTLGDMTLVAHRLPGTMTSLVTLLDLEQSLATVFECWFGSETFPTREVQRVIYHGYIEGNDIPSERHKPTRRLTGKGIVWTDDTGAEELTICASHYCMSFVPLSVPDAGDTFTAPADYIVLDERYYLTARVEVEFSGRLVLDVIDLFSTSAVGVRLGLDENSALDFRMVTSTGRLVGHLSAYGPFGLAAADPIPPWPGQEAQDSQTQERGFRPAYRPFQSSHPMTLAEVDEAVTNGKLWVGGFQGANNEHKETMLPPTNKLSGKSFILRFDSGCAWEYEITDAFGLRFRDVGETMWREERCEVFESDEDLYFLTHALTGTLPFESRAITLDFREGLVTCVSGVMANEQHPREPIQSFLFGVIDMPGVEIPKYKRHGYTAELVGTSYMWTYSRQITSQHIYTTPWSYSWTIVVDGMTPSVMWSSPCRYAKIRDGIYVMSWVEDRSQGIMSTILFNTKTMHDCGVGFGVNHDQVFDFNTFGAEARYAGTLDIADLF